MRPCAEHDDLGCPVTRINRVNGQGGVPCDIMLIGEAPGKTEDKKGMPFCGKSGSELTHLYLAKCAQIDRKNVFVTNLVKCRTNDKDRDPTEKEIRACSQLLMNELAKVKPRFVGIIGRIATQWLLDEVLLDGHVGMENVRMEKIHGFGYIAGNQGVKVMPLYHPAYGLHNTAMMRHIMEDWTRFGKMVRGDESVMWRAR